MHVAVADVILGSTPLNEDDFFTAVSAEVWL